MPYRALDSNRWKTPDLTAVRAWGWASVAANVGILTTGGLVRLTGSGLGCPTWPQCTDASYIPHSAMGIHAAIEFGNRMVTVAVAAVAVVTWLVVMRHRPPRTDLRRLATFAALGVPLQAVIGGISVLTGLNPWIVSTHFLVSLLMVTLTVTLALRAGAASVDLHIPPAVRALAATCLITAWLVLVLGTVVTGAGPHAGDPGSGRNGFDETAISQLHTDAVSVLFGATVALVVVARATDTTRTVRRLATVVLVTEIAQGAIGFTQYFTGLPWGLVIVHMTMSAVLTVAVTALFDHTQHGTRRGPVAHTLPGAGTGR